MIYFTLPNFYQHFYVNNFLCTINKMHPECFKEKISFIQASGSFPFCSWNGGVNENIGTGSYYQDFIACANQSAVPLRINFANVLLEDFDFDNVMGNLILSTNNNGSNVIEISNLELMEKIQNEYPEYNRFVFSKQADLIHPFTAELLNEILELDKFYLIGIPDYLTQDKKFLQGISKRTKIEITVNPFCPIKCPNQKECLIAEHQRQLDYSNYSQIFNCSKIYPYGMHSKVKTLDDLKREYIPLGINHFNFAESLQGSSYDVLHFYLDYFIKDQYKEGLLMDFLTAEREFAENG